MVFCFVYISQFLGSVCIFWFRLNVTQITKPDPHRVATIANLQLYIFNRYELWHSGIIWLQVGANWFKSYRVESFLALNPIVFSFGESPNHPSLVSTVIPTKCSSNLGYDIHTTTVQTCMIDVQKKFTPHQQKIGTARLAQYYATRQPIP